jgi:hypothetical protein
MPGSSSTYQIGRRAGTMGVRGTAFDVTVRNGRHRIDQRAQIFCAGFMSNETFLITSWRTEVIKARAHLQLSNAPQQRDISYLANPIVSSRFPYRRRQLPPAGSPLLAMK